MRKKVRKKFQGFKNTERCILNPESPQEEQCTEVKQYNKDGVLSGMYILNHKNQYQSFEDRPALVGYYSNGLVKEQKWYEAGRCSRPDNKPAAEYFNEHGMLCVRLRLLDGELHTSDPQIPSQEFWHPNGTQSEVQFHSHGREHRVDQWAMRQWDKTGQLIKEIWMFKGNLHCKTGPALTEWSSDGSIKRRLYQVIGNEPLAQEIQARFEGQEIMENLNQEHAEKEEKANITPRIKRL